MDYDGTNILNVYGYMLTLLSGHVHTTKKGIFVRNLMGMFLWASNMYS